jgi:hypothetical protein
LPIYTIGAFSFDYERDRMKSAKLNGNELRSTLLELIRTGSKPAMDDISDKIFTSIERLDSFALLA